MNVVQVCSMDILVLFIAACEGLGNRDTDRTCTWYATVLPLTQTARAGLRRVVLPLHQQCRNRSRGDVRASGGNMCGYAFDLYACCSRRSDCRAFWMGGEVGGVAACNRRVLFFVIKNTYVRERNDSGKMDNMYCCVTATMQFLEQKQPATMEAV